MTNRPTNLESLRTVKSNEQRLKSLDEHEREKRNRKSIIKDSLNNQNKGKHLKFDSDDDNDNQPKEFVEKKLQLFDNDDGFNVDEHFNEKKNSKKRKQLQNLQTHLINTNDPRFKLSEQFLDDNRQKSTTIDDDDDDRTGGDNNNNNNDISFEEEKKRSLAILDKMTKAKSAETKSKTKMIRFDPSKTEHRVYELDSEIKSTRDDSVAENTIKPKSILKQTNEHVPVVDTKRVYEFDETKLKSLFNKTFNEPAATRGNSGFQFQFFHNDESTSAPVEHLSQLPQPIRNGKSKVLVNKLDDTSSEEDEHEEPSLTEKVETKQHTFFFFDIDDCLQEGLESFVRTEDTNELQRTWPTRRKEIAEALRTKHRKAIQRKDKRRIYHHRQRQKQRESSDAASKLNLD